MDLQIAQPKSQQQVTLSQGQCQGLKNLTEVAHGLDTSEHNQQVAINHKPEICARKAVNYRKNVFSKLNNQKQRRGDCKQKLLSYKIKKQFQEYAIKNAKIIDFIKNISKQIKESLLQQSFCTQNDTSQPAQLTHQSPNSCQINTNRGVVSFRTVEDQEVIRQNQLRQLLVPTAADNDVSSDEEDLRKGMTYLYRELVKSVGENYLQSKINKETKEKKVRAKQSNKQNDFNTVNTSASTNTEKKKLIKPKGNRHFVVSNSKKAKMIIS